METENALTSTRLYRSRSLACLLLFALVALVIPPSIAAKPGSTGSRSTGSLGISLTVPSSVRARYIQTDTDTVSLAKQHEDYLCISSQNPRGFRYFLVNNSDYSDAITMHSLRLSERMNVASNNSVESDCRLTLNIDVDTSQQSKQTPLLLIVSPE